MEEWRDIKGYEGIYQISNFGNVKSLERLIIRGNIRQLRRERIMSKRENSDGYYIAKFNVDKKSISIAIHRLVAQSFIPNPNNLPEVNHKDFNRKNNNVENLEWCTHRDNVIYSAERKRYSNRTGCKNPNYQNHTLHKKYQNNPELRKLQSRPKSVNGNAKKIALYDCDKKYINTFNYIGSCCEFLIQNNFTSAKINSIRANIREAINNEKTYLNHYYKFI